MALTSTILTTAPGDIFQSNGNTAITSMYICNTGNITVYFNIYAVPNGSQTNNSRLIYYRVPLVSYDTYVIDSEKLILNNGDKLRANIVDPSSLSVIGLTQTAWGSTDRVNTAFWSTDRNEYLIGGNHGKLATSATGENWVFQNGLSLLGWPYGIPVNDITRIPYKKYVVVGNSGWIATSSDGVSWGNQTALSTTAWSTANVYAVANNGSFYMVVGASGKVATSFDGLTWTVRTGLATTGWGISDIWSVIWTGTVFLIGGDGGKIASTVDGITWNYSNSLVNNPAWGSSTRVTSLSYSGSPTVGYMATTLDSNKVAISLDGVTWTYDAGLATVATSSTVGLGAIAYRPGDGFYVGAASSDVFRKDLSNVWTRISSLNLPPWSGFFITDLVWNDEQSEFIAVGYNARVATSNNGETWTFRSSGTTGGISIPDVVVTVSTIGI